MSGRQNHSFGAPKRPQWRSLILRPTSLILLLLSELALLAVIVDLWALSTLHAGFVNVGVRGSASNVNGSTTRFDRVRPLLWTTLPTAILTLYRIFREAAVSALTVETPFIELFKSSATQPTRVRKSVYVDYRTTFGILAWYKAMKNGHVFLGLCMLFSFVVSLGLVPLAGGLFTEGAEVLAEDAAVHVLSEFNPNANISTDFVDYGSLFDTVSASWINTASYPTGTDGYFPLPDIEPVGTIGNYTISTNAATSQLSLDCVVVSDATFSIDNGTQKILSTSFTANDRDCEITGDILTVAISTPEMIYMKAYSKTNCPTWAGRTRVVLLYVRTLSSAEWQDYNLISCIPSYWTVNGVTSMTSTLEGSGRVTKMPSFRESSRKVEELPNGMRERFEQDVMNVQTINVGSDVTTPTRFAELVYRYIIGRRLEFTSTSLIDATSTIYSAIYVMLGINDMFPLLDQPVQQDGTLSISENRLHVVFPVAIAMTIILVGVIIESVYLIIYLHKHPTILAEEPIGLMGIENVLYNSNMPCLLARYHEQPDYDGRLRRRQARQNTIGGKSASVYTDEDLLNRYCWVERAGTSQSMRIVIETRDSDDECASHLHGHVYATAKASHHSQGSNQVNKEPFHTIAPLLSRNSEEKQTRDNLSDHGRPEIRTNTEHEHEQASREEQRLRSQQSWTETDRDGFQHTEPYPRSTSIVSAVSSSSSTRNPPSQLNTRYPSLSMGHSRYDRVPTTQNYDDERYDGYGMAH